MAGPDDECEPIAAEVAEDGIDAENVALLSGEVGTSVAEAAEGCDVVRPAGDNVEEDPIESGIEPQIMDDIDVENAWWEKCIMCNQQAGSQEEFLKHTSDNHLQLGFSGYVTDIVPESGNDKDCVVGGGQDGDITDNVEAKLVEGDIVPGRVDNVESLPRTEVGKKESESVTKSKAISDGSRHVMKELVMSLKRMGKLHLIFTSAPGNIIGWFATEYGISVEELRLKLKEVLETECVDEVKEKIPCEAVSKVPEPVLEMREEESVMTPAQKCQKRKGLMVLGPEKRRRLEKVQEPKVIPVGAECCELFSSAWKLERHVKRTHKSTLKCDLCKFGTENKQAFIIHRKQHAQEYFQCEQCNKTVTLRKSLLRHVREQHEALRFSCPHCNYHTNRKYHLIEHKKTHIVKESTLKPKRSIRVEGEFENDSGLLGKDVATSVGGGTEEDDEDMVEDSTEEVYDFDYEGYDNDDGGVIMTAVAMSSSGRTEEGAQKVMENETFEGLSKTSDGVALTEDFEEFFAEIDEIVEQVEFFAEIDEIVEQEEFNAEIDDIMEKSLD